MGFGRMLGLAARLGADLGKIFSKQWQYVSLSVYTAIGI